MHDLSHDFLKIAHDFVVGDTLILSYPIVSPGVTGAVKMTACSGLTLGFLDLVVDLLCLVEEKSVFTPYTRRPSILVCIDASIISSLSPDFCLAAAAWLPRRSNQLISLPQTQCHPGCSSKNCQF